MSVPGSWQKFPPGACAVMCGKWLQESARELRSVAGDVNWAKMVGTFQVPISGESVHYAGTAAVGGQPALKLSFPGDGTMFVAAHGTPYPLPVSAGANQLSFTDCSTAKLPPAAKVTAASQLAAGG